MVNRGVAFRFTKVTDMTLLNISEIMALTEGVTNSIYDFPLYDFPLAEGMLMKSEDEFSKTMLKLQPLLQGTTIVFDGGEDCNDFMGLYDMHIDGILARCNTFYIIDGDEFMEVDTDEFIDGLESCFSDYVDNGDNASSTRYCDNCDTELKDICCSNDDGEQFCSSKCLADNKNIINRDGGSTTLYNLFEDCIDVDSVCFKNDMTFAEGTILKSLMGLVMQRTKGISRHTAGEDDPIRDARKIKSYIEKIIKHMENDILH